MGHGAAEGCVSDVAAAAALNAAICVVCRKRRIGSDVINAGITVSMA